MGRVEVADVCSASRSYVLRSRGSRLIRAVLAELIVLETAPRIAVAAAPPAAAHALVELQRDGVVLPLAAIGPLEHRDVAEFREGPQQLPSGTVARAQLAGLGNPEERIADLPPQRCGVPPAARAGTSAARVRDRFG